ncbi:hypothetical protein A0H81_09357 [Grifola frondosa]|uniref:F-box domain-containing protein n=1 Tax=Grifola frondosa TaxID=5627 RepID=A0A1C7M2W2_GRIFR|nr:hypothetical protein A0H81_09357 [Grifola frondosa]
MCKGCEQPWPAPVSENAIFGGRWAYRIWRSVGSVLVDCEYCVDVEFRGSTGARSKYPRLALARNDTRYCPPLPHTPHTDHSSVPPEVWLEIFRYATDVPNARCTSPGDAFAPEHPANFACMNTPVLGGAHQVRPRARVPRVARARDGAAVRTRRAVQHPPRAAAPPHAAGERPARRATGRGPRALGAPRRDAHVRALGEHAGVLARPRYALPGGFLDVFRNYNAQTLRMLYWAQDAVEDAADVPIFTSPFLAAFTELRVLDLRKTTFADRSAFPPDHALAQMRLPCVAELLLPTCPLILRFASKQDLPALHRLVLDAGIPSACREPSLTTALNAFFERHGTKVTVLELLPRSSSYNCIEGPISLTTFLQPTACPNLDTFVFDACECVISVAPLAGPGPSLPSTREDSPTEECLREPHPHLRRIGIRGLSTDNLYPIRRTHAQAHLRAFRAHHALFPALELVRTLGHLVEASADPFAMDVFIWWTERFEDVGVDLQDGEGVVWLYTEPTGEEPCEDCVVALDEACLVHKNEEKRLKEKWDAERL